MARPPGEGRSAALSGPTYFRPREEHKELVREIAAEEDRDVATVIRRIFEAGLAVKYPAQFAKLHSNFSRRQTAEKGVPRRIRA